MVEIFASAKIDNHFAVGADDAILLVFVADGSGTISEGVVFDEKKLRQLIAVNIEERGAFF